MLETAAFAIRSLVPPRCRPAVMAACLLAAAPLLAQTPSPRAKLEAAHYADSVQRDAAAAEGGYRAAIEAARAAGDAKTAEEAQVALDALLARSGKAPARPEAAQELPAGIVQLLSGGSDEFAVRCRSLALYGDQIVPLLAQCVATPAGASIMVVHREGSYTHVNDPLLAVSTLALVRTPAADKALVGALGSNDPVFRHKVVAAVDKTRLDVLLAASNDAVDAIRALAASKALQSDDPGVAQLARASALRGEREGVEWLARNDWRAAWALAEQGVPGLDPLNVFRSMNAARIMYAEGFPAFEAAVRLHMAAKIPVVREESERLLSQMPRHLMPQDGGTRGSMYGPELDQRMHALARATRLPVFLDALSLTDPVDRILTASAYVRDGALDQKGLSSVEMKLLPGDLRDRPRESKSLVELATLVAARKDDPAELSMLARIGTLMASRDRVDEDEATSLERLDEAIALSHVLRTPAQRAAMTKIAVRAVNGRRDKLRRALLPTGSMPKTAISLGEWLLETGNHEEFAVEAMNVYAAGGSSDANELLPKLCDLLQAGRKQVALVGRQVVERAHAEDAAATRAILAERLARAVAAAASGADAAHVLVANLSILAQHLPDDEGVGIIRAVAANASPACVARLVILPRDVTDGRSAPTPGQLGMLVELLPRAMAIDEGGGVVAALAIFQRTLHEPALPVIGAALRSSSLDVRTAAQEAMKVFREQREALEEFEMWMQAARQEASTTTQLVELLRSDDRAVVLGAVRSLAAIKARAALPELVKLIGRGDKELTAAVEAAIAAMAAGAPDLRPRD
ncbi:MAG: hypothetical protein RL112_542 [Planctomycetota bacterium]